MRLQHPDDELGGMLLLNLPNIVVHAMDNWSPLVPHPMDLALWRAPSPLPHESDHQDEDDDNYDGDADDWYTAQRSADDDDGGPETCARVNSRQHWHDPMSQCRFPDVLQRASDCENGNRDSIMCATCGETFPHSRALRKHTRYNCIGDEISGWEMSLMCSVCGETFPSRTALRLHVKSSANCEEARTAAQEELESGADAPVLTTSHEQRDAESARYRRNMHRDMGRTGQNRRGPTLLDASTMSNNSDCGTDLEHEACNSRQLIEEWLEATQAEIIVLVEGIDATTSYTVQARHSYTWQELAWDCTFAQTVFPSERPPIRRSGASTGADGGEIAQQGCMIDFTKFNDVVPVRSDGKKKLASDLNTLPAQPQQRHYGEIQ